jgi:S1-C subfamily serine protease
MATLVLTPPSSLLSVAGAGPHKPDPHKSGKKATPASGKPARASVKNTKKTHRQAEESVVRVSLEQILPSYAQPWTRNPKTHSTGTGFCMELRDPATGKPRHFIITNHHCIRDAWRVEVQRASVNKPLPGKVRYYLEECDLAIVESDLATDMPPLQLAGAVPDKTDTVYILGFPFGGHNLSVSQSQLNRIIIGPYTTGTRGICYQVDGAINPGNSGGPVVNAAGAVVGVVYRKRTGQDVSNYNFVIPLMVLEHCIQRFEAGAEIYGLCQLPIMYMNAENPAMRAHYNLGRDDPGVLVVRSSEPLLKVGDVLVRVCGAQVDADGTVFLRDVYGKIDSDEIVDLQGVVALRPRRERVEVEVIRHGKTHRLQIPLRVQEFSVPVFEYQRPPGYLMVGGLVFVPLTIGFVWEMDEMEDELKHLTAHIQELDLLGKHYSDHPEIIVLSQVLDNELTVGYESQLDILLEFNGRVPASLAEMHGHIQEAVKAKKGYLQFLVSNGRVPRMLVLDAAQVAGAQEQIMADYGMRADYM